jgi:hypothetical protein
VSGFHLWRGRARDLQGRRAGALADYRAVFGRKADAPVRAAARKGLKRPYPKAKLVVDFVLGDVVEP